MEIPADIYWPNDDVAFFNTSGCDLPEGTQVFVNLCGGKMTPVKAVLPSGETVSFPTPNQHEAN
jgi:hypothetical protein